MKKTSRLQVGINDRPMDPSLPHAVGGRRTNSGQTAGFAEGEGFGPVSVGLPAAPVVVCSCGWSWWPAAWGELDSGGFAGGLLGASYCF